MFQRLLKKAKCKDSEKVETRISAQLAARET